MASAQSTAVFAIIAKDSASGVMRGIGKQMGSLGKTGGAVFKTIAAGAAIAAAAITTAFGLAAKFTKSAIEAAIADDAEQQKLIATLKARGATTEEATKRVNELIAAGQKLAFTDSETRKGYEIATSFAKKYANQQKILTTAQDLARAKNISLEAATKLVGRAFAGNTGALSRYGIQIEKGAKGVEALGAINKKVAGVAEQYSKTFAGQFDIVRDSINETVESIGMAIGGGEGLPTFVRLLEGIRPVVDDLIGEINKNLPNIQAFSRELVEKFLAKLPGYVATAKRELPILIDKLKEFIGGVGGFAKDVAGFLGPDGLITAGIAGVGFKMGGLAGGIGAVFAEQFIKMGVDPITATLTGTIGGAITAGVIQGFGSALAQAAITKFLGLFKSVQITPSIPTTAPTGVAPVPGGGGGGFNIANLLTPLYVATQLPGAIDDLQKTIKAIFDPKAGAEYRAQGQDSFLGNLLGPDFKAWWTGTPKAISDGIVDGIKAVPPQAPINLSSATTLMLDGQVVAESVDRRLGITAALNNGGRVNYRGPR
ncbi:hypothetical protein UFOVP1573_38 [uncultured Caudovirales phage]|uniref:Uncharacterized protein n=1 Tax=uncultured Caudovirales phage TaxID=2100421 RepID=A0A6J5QL48_9CAUD|nr:hypothetical protein UFOVP1126_21 [uncultured Caudovirales phage]CAB4215437.1 hypothetical protein UFOVP1485_21 [uncultured Caudovirales phage]CAB5230572.1 hypothetical protein UFOVP1573_38 [uncultured Caudovirales phage]